MCVCVCTRKQLHLHSTSIKAPFVACRSRAVHGFVADHSYAAVAAAVLVATLQTIPNINSHLGDALGRADGVLYNSWLPIWGDQGCGLNGAMGDGAVSAKAKELVRALDASLSAGAPASYQASASAGGSDQAIFEAMLNQNLGLDQDPR